ncbi:Threonine aldolase [Borealophlyctis nickersoniae]|nr:Threonine aldolase [Borealophlyctis nickersoniae]
MSNQLAVRTHLREPPYTVLCDARSHLQNYEVAGISYHCGAGTIPVHPPPGKHHLTVDVIRANLILDDDIHHAPTKLICLENTLDGEIFPIKEISDIASLASDVSVPLHLDGARLWNATIASGIELKDWCQHFQSVSLCLSKGEDE